MNYKLKIYRGMLGLDKIAAEWNGLFDQMSHRHYFHLREWYASYISTLEKSPGDVVFCLIHDLKENTPVALLPLKQETRVVKGIKVRSLELPRDDHMLLRDILISDSKLNELSVAQLARILKQSPELQWDVLALWHCLEDSCTATAYRVQAPFLSVCTHRFGSSYVPLQPWDQFLGTLSKSFRQNLRTAHNRAKLIEGLKLEVAESPAQLAPALAEFLDVEASGWKGAMNTSIKQDKNYPDFYKTLTERFGPAGQCEIHILKAGEKPIAGLFLLLTDRTVYIPKLGYDENYARISPVHLLLENLFKRCDQNGLTEINLTSDAVWFNVWKPSKRKAYNIYVFNTTLVGMAVGVAMIFAQKGNFLRTTLHRFAGSAR